MNQAVDYSSWCGPAPIKTSENSVVISTGEEITLGLKNIRIRRADGNAELSLDSIIDQDFFDEKRGYCQKVFWGLSPKWSDGQQLSAHEVSVLAGKVRAASEVLNCNIWQLYW